MKRLHPLLIVATIATIRVVLLAYSGSFRRTFARDVLASTRQDLREAAAVATGKLLRASVVAIWDAIAGVVPERAARRRAKRAARRRRGAATAMETTAQDLKHAMRFLLRSRGFALTAVLTFAVGIGSTAAILTVVDAVFRPLPFREYDRLVTVLEHDPTAAETFGGGMTTSQTFLDWRRMQMPFEALAAVMPESFDVRDERNEPARASAYRVTWEFFDVLRTDPLLGRTLTSDDEIPGRHRVAVLSHGFWQRRFGGVADVLGKRLDLGRQSFEVVGVLPSGFVYPIGRERPVDVYVPLPFSNAAKSRTAGGRMHNLTVLGRLKKDVSLALAHDQMEGVAAALRDAHPAWHEGRSIRVVSLSDHLVGPVRLWMVALLGAATFVLLIACVNVAHLLIARATARKHELAVRSALGASRWRLIRMALIEGLALSILGTVVGVGLAVGAVDVLRAWMPPELPRIGAVAINVRVIGAMVAVAVAAGCLSALAPAIQSLRQDVIGALKDSAPSATSSRATERLRGALLIGEVALTVALVIGAGLFFTSFVKLVRVDSGFDFRNVLALAVNLPPGPGSFDDRLARSSTDVQRLLDAVGSLPTVQMAGAVYGGLPFSGGRTSTVFERPEHAGVTAEIDRRTISAEYLQTLRVPLLRGRHLEPEDTRTSPQVAVINDSAARRYWPGDDAVGRRVTLDGERRTIVGVVGDIRDFGPEERPAPTIYVPMTQDRMFGATLVIRTTGPPHAALPEVKRAIWSVNPEQRFDTELLTLEAYMDRFLSRRRFNMALLTLFGLVGVVIAAVGIHGVVRYIVAHRTKEIGLRLALGATPASVMRLMLARTALILSAGLAVGGFAAWHVATSVRSFLFETEPHDPRIFVSAVAVVCSAALIASASPVYRASRIDPVDVLRRE